MLEPVPAIPILARGIAGHCTGGWGIAGHCTGGWGTAGWGTAGWGTAGGWAGGWVEVPGRWVEPLGCEIGGGVSPVGFNIPSIGIACS